MRYALHNSDNELIARANSAQEIADLAEHGTFSEDTDQRGAWRFTAYERGSIGLEGVPMMYRVDAILYCKKIKGV